MKKLSFLLLVAVCLAPVSAQTFPTSTALPLPIPDLSPGTSLNVPVLGAAPGSTLSLDFTMSPAHTWCADLECVVTNPDGVSVTVLMHGSGGSADVGGPFTLSDSAATTFHTAPVVGGQITPGTWRGDNLLDPLVSHCNPDGLWTVTWSDWAGGDTGSVSNLSLTFGTGAPAEFFCIAQSGPGAPVTLTQQAGSNFIIYTNAAVANNPAAAPGGWWYGVDVPLPLLLDQLTNPIYGSVFIGTLPPFGVNVISAGLPAGFSIQIVGVHFDAATGLKVYNSPASNYVVL